MLARIRKAQEEEGFTLIELLVVIIIIGILAAIAIPVFLNQRKKGWDAAVKSDLRNLATSLETYNTDWGHYVDKYVTAYGAGSEETQGAQFTPSNWTNYDGATSATAPSPTTYFTIFTYDSTTTAAKTTTGLGVGSYCIAGKSASTKVWVFNSAKGGLQQYDSTKTDATTACPNSNPGA